MQVLVVDDDEIFCRFLVEALEDAGISAIFTTNGLEAYELMTCKPYDLCIIDVRMPLILGTELAEAIKEEFPRAKIILASAFADQTLREYARRKEIRLLSKPFTKLELFDTVHLALRDSMERN